MIKFFRRIRQNLLMKNKTSQYFKYAIGEIILVVIGILIALQINNWNEKNKIAKEENLLLRDLKGNIEKDIDNLNLAIKNDSIFLVSCKIVLSAFEDHSILKNKPEFIKTAIRSSFAAGFTPTNTIFNTLSSTGKLGYISSKSLRIKIQEYYDLSNYVVEGDNTNLNLIYVKNFEVNKSNILDTNSFSQPAIPEFARYEFDDLDVSFFYKSTKSPEVITFANNVSAKQSLMSGIYRNHIFLLERAQQLKTELTNFLKSKE